MFLNNKYESIEEIFKDEKLFAMRYWKALFVKHPEFYDIPGPTFVNLLAEMWSKQFTLEEPEALMLALEFYMMSPVSTLLKL